MITHRIEVMHLGRSIVGLLRTGYPPAHDLAATTPLDTGHAIHLQA
jgi:hypothetical protein